MVADSPMASSSVRLQNKENKGGIKDIASSSPRTEQIKTWTKTIHSLGREGGGHVTHTTSKLDPTAWSNGTLQNPKIFYSILHQLKETILTNG